MAQDRSDSPGEGRSSQAAPVAFQKKPSKSLESASDCLQHPGAELDPLDESYYHNGEWHNADIGHLEDDVWKVSEILKHYPDEAEDAGSATWYMVKWEGPYTQNVEPKENISAALIDSYWVRFHQEQQIAQLEETAAHLEAKLIKEVKDKIAYLKGISLEKIKDKYE